MEELTRQTELTLVTLLGQRFGDGLVYVQSEADRMALERAMRRGLVDREGYLTRAGRQCWKRCADRL